MKTTDVLIHERRINCYLTRSEVQDILVNYIKRVLNTPDEGRTTVKMTIEEEREGSPDYHAGYGARFLIVIDQTLEPHE